LLLISKKEISKKKSFRLVPFFGSGKQINKIKVPFHYEMGLFKYYSKMNENSIFGTRIHIRIKYAILSDFNFA